jgi:hypothetical protein
MYNDFYNYELQLEDLIPNCNYKAEKRAKKLKNDGNIEGWYSVTASAYLHQSLRYWRPYMDFRNPYAITLTLKEKIRINDENGNVYFLKTNKENASTNLRHFLNRFNSDAYGHKYRSRTGIIRMPCIPILEGDGEDKRYHYHLLVDAPAHLLNGDANPDVPDEPFRNKVCFHWGKTNLAYSQIVIRKITDIEGWNKYIHKENIKNDI